VNSIGSTRRIDQLGRIVVPAEMRRLLDIRDGDLLEIHVEDGHIVLGKLDERCVFCGGTDDLRPHRGRPVCHGCVEELTA